MGTACFHPSSPETHNARGGRREKDSQASPDSATKFPNTDVLGEAKAESTLAETGTKKVPRALPVGLHEKMTRHFYLPFEKQGRIHYDRTSIRELTEYEKYQLSFHPERPKYRDYLSLFSNVEECLGSGEFGGDLIQIHRAVYTAGNDTYSLMLIGQQSGPSSDYDNLMEDLKDPELVRRWNHGMPVPESYKRAILAIEVANHEDRMLIIFVDTPGADPTEESEAGGIAWRIGETIQALVEARVPTLSVIMNRACSGGAIALTGCDVTLAMENSTYLVITPEACSSILFHTRHRADEAAEASRITSREGLELGIVDELILEPKGPAHRFKSEAIQSLGESLKKWIPLLHSRSGTELFSQRVDRWRRIGHWEEMKEEDVKRYQHPVSRLPKPGKEGFIKRHKSCYNDQGVHIYDPVEFDSLKANNYVCTVCGYRYVRPSAWDYMNLILDSGTFQEHRETRHLADKDILEFPGYKEKLHETRKNTGLITAIITGDGQVQGQDIIYCGTDFGFLGGSFCMTTGEKIWRAAEIAMSKKWPMVIQAAGGGARMHEGCSSMVSIPKAHLALTRVERCGLPVITVITDPTLGGVAIGIGSRGIRLFEINAGNIGFSGRRVIEQYTGHKTSKDFQTTTWLQKHGHVSHVVTPGSIQSDILRCIRADPPE